jgi:hypothetical protein
MKTLRHYLFIGIGCLLPGMSLAQGAFQNCTAAFLGSKMVVNEYAPTGKCRLPATATGELTLCTVDLSPAQSKAVDKIDFTVAIRDKDTGTLTMFSGETFRQILVQNVLAKCKKGDHIVLLTLDRRYALPHNEILVL